MTIADRLQRTNKKRMVLLQKIAQVSDASLTAKPTADQWSIVEIVEHLVLAEQAVLGDATRFDELTPCPRTLASTLRFALVMSVLRLGIRVKVPAEAMRPSGQLSFETLRVQWDSQFALLQKFVLARNRANSGSAIFFHPVAGPLSVKQALWMLEVHLDSHMQQIEQQINQLWRRS